jgi:uncharacterized protein (TIGR02147 family)
MDVFSHKSYRALLKDWLTHKAGRGGQKRLADAAGCLPSYLSQVLSGAAELTPDQAYGMTVVMELDKEQADFMMRLVQRDRASSRLYRDHLTRGLEETSRKKQQLSEKLSPARVISGEDQARYYAAWYYPAIHTLASIPEFQTAKALEQRLNLGRDVMARALEDLERMELIRRDGARVIALAKNIHAASTSALNFSYHTVWRAIANQKMQEQPAGRNVHYTALYGLSKADAQILKSMMTDFIQRTREVVAPSVEETAVCLTCDIFEV